MIINYSQCIGTRKEQEDYFVIQATRDAVGIHVLDGHGGKDCADLCASCLEQDIIPRINMKDENAEIVRGLQGISTRFEDRGTTLSSVYVVDGKLYISILGDSPVFPIYKGKVKKILLHDSANDKEFKLRKEKGKTFPSMPHHIFNDNDKGLSCFRTIGDKQMGDIIGREPEFYEIEQWDSVVIATDGLKLPPKEIVNLVDYGAEALLTKNKEFLFGRSIDNTTIVCLRK